MLYYAVIRRLSTAEGWIGCLEISGGQRTIVTGFLLVIIPPPPTVVSYPVTNTSYFCYPLYTLYSQITPVR